MRSYTEEWHYYDQDETADSVRDKYIKREGREPASVFFDLWDGNWKAGPVKVLVQETAEVAA